MESFFLAETTKYLYLLFDTDNFIHNNGQRGTIIDTPNGECVIETGGYVFNTEAHPIDPSALHCCHVVPKQRLHDFAGMHAKRALFKGELLGQRRNKEASCGTSVEDGVSGAEDVDRDVGNKEEGADSNETVVDFVREIFMQPVKRFDPQEQLERIRSERVYGINETWAGNYGLLSCKAQPFLQKMSILGEFFNA